MKSRAPSRSASAPTPPLAALRSRFAELFGNSPPARMRAPLLVAAIAWKEQVLIHGDIPPALDRDLNMIADELCRARTGETVAVKQKLPLPPPSTQLQPGTRLARSHAGVTHLVEVTHDGFCHQGATYRSLSAVAKAITGTHWNGLLFFGLRRRRTPGGSTSQARRQENAPAAGTTRG